jgi:hypothetical protein
MLKLPELKKIMRDNKIKGSSYMNKPEIIALLLENGIIFEEKQDVEREIDPKYEFIRFIRNNPKSVEIRDLETDEITTYSSIYKASRALCCSTKVITSNNGKVWKNKYDIKIQ